MEIISNLLVHQRHSGYPLPAQLPLVNVYRSCNPFAMLSNESFVMHDAVDHVWREIGMHNSETNGLAKQHVDSAMWLMFRKCLILQLTFLRTLKLYTDGIVLRV